jgi:uncharacterized protein (TIGR02246 family)
MADAEQELRALVEERVRAVHEKDAATLAEHLDREIVTFDAIAPLNSRGKHAVEERTQAWFDSYDGPIGYEVDDLQVSVDGDVGLCSFVYHVTGTITSGDQVDMWVRATLGCRRTDGKWRIVHDHESVPFDPATGQALTSLHPS